MEIPAPHRNTTLPRSRSASSSSGMMGPSTKNRISITTGFTSPDQDPPVPTSQALRHFFWERGLAPVLPIK